MPELPEVITVINYLKPKLIGKKIKDIILHYDKVIQNVEPKYFYANIINKEFINIYQKGKYLIFNLSDNFTLVIHLRMEGKLFIQKQGSNFNFNQIICEFILDDENVLRFYDTRKFGTFDLVNTNELNELKGIKKLAIDAIDDRFNVKYLFSIIQNSSQAIKTFLLDQSNVAGLGNIYVNEVLYKANILPTRKTKSITYDECEQIVKYSKEILFKSIKNKGSTIHSYKFSEYDSGGYQKFLQVHTKFNKPCPRCGNLIQFTKVNGRGTYFCNFCQK